MGNELSSATSQALGSVNRERPENDSMNIFNSGIIEYKERERGLGPLIQGGFQEMEFEREIHERINIKR